MKTTYSRRAASALLLSTIIATPAFTVAPVADTTDLEEIVVSSAYPNRSVAKTILGTSVLTKDMIARRMEGTIGELLASQPGVSSTYFGPGASRPVIRGLGGSRVAVLDAGLGSIDASSTSPDHAVAIEPALAERIEILRGSAILMYGSSAAGGVVNIFDNRIPSDVDEKGYEGGLRLSRSTVNDGYEASGAINAALFSDGDTALLWHGDLNWRDTDDYDIPGFAESATLRALEEAEHEEEEEHEDEEDGHEEEEEAFGILENSFTKVKSGSTGLTYKFADGFFGFNIKHLDSEYGIPGGHGHGEEEGHDDEDEDHEDEDEHGEEEELVSIDLKQTRIDLMGEWATDFAIFQKAKFRFGYADYEHTELEGDEIGTIFENEGYEARLDLVEKGGKNWSGATGVQISSRDFSAIGAEAFVPPTDSRQIGLYTVKEFIHGPWTIDAGARLEFTDHDNETANVSRSFTGLSASFGAGYDIDEDRFIGIHIARSERAPTTEELFSNGPHLATNAFEVGDPTLDKETSFNVELMASYSGDKFSAIGNVFYTAYEDFIYEAISGEEEDGLPVFNFLSTDAEFYGFEGQIKAHVGEVENDLLGTVDMHIEGQLDLVRANLTSGNNDPLPRIPPLSALIAFEAETKQLTWRTEVEYADSQTRVAENELPTDDYFLWNMHLSVRPFENQDVSLNLRVKNILDEEVRNHTSFLKDLVPLPGRDVRLSLGWTF